MVRSISALLMGVTFIASSVAWGHNDNGIRDEKTVAIYVKAKDKFERTALAKQGFAIDGIASDHVTVFGTEKDVERLKDLGFSFETQNLSNFDDFPSSDSAFHNFKETTEELDAIANQYPSISKRFSIGNSLEGRKLEGIRLSTATQQDTLPTVIFMGCHHAREHLSVEVPLKMARHLAENFSRSSRIQRLLETTEIYIVPMINPDGAEYDIASGSYKSWRKNRRKNGDGTYGVDLNRNYGGGPGFFGGEGSSSDPSSDVYHGPSEFSEPETQAVRDFVRARKKTTMLLSFHTFSELILWPYGHVYEEIPNETDRKVFETMGKKMAEWNHYTPQKSSELYLAAGDTTDWAYSELKIFAFTFELTPTSIFGGGFYPGAKAIEPTFKDNLEPMLYMIEHAPSPYSVLSNSKDPLGIL